MAECIPRFPIVGFGGLGWSGVTIRGSNHISLLVFEMFVPFGETRTENGNG